MTMRVPAFSRPREPAGSVTALAVDPEDTKTLYAAINEAGQFALYISKDWGAHWQRTEGLGAGAQKIYLDPRSPQKDRTLYVVGNNSVNIARAASGCRLRRRRAWPGFLMFRPDSPRMAS